MVGSRRKSISFVIIQVLLFSYTQVGSAAQVEYSEMPPVRDTAMIKELIDWTPTGAPEFHKQPLGECEPYNVRSFIANNGPVDSPSHTKNKILSCLDRWEIPSSMLGNLIEFSAINYNYEGNRSFKYLKIKLPNSKIVRGIIGK